MPPSLRDTLGYLVYLLGPTLVAAACGEPDPIKVSYWPDVDGPEPGRADIRRMEWTFWAVEHMRAHRGSDATKTWLLTENPLLGGRSPIRTVREGNYSALRCAVEMDSGT